MKNNRKEKTQKQQIFQKFIQFTVKQLLIVQQKSPSLNNVIIFACLIFQQLQLLCLWLDAPSSYNFKIDELLLILLQNISYFIQPYKGAIKEENLVICTFALNIALQTYFIFDYLHYWDKVHRTTKQDKYTKYFEKKSEFQQHLSMMVLHLLNCFNVLLLIPFTEFNFIVLMDQFRNHQHFHLIIITIYNLISYIILSFSFFLLLNESLTIKLKNFQNLRTEFVDYICYFIQLLMIILNHIFGKMPNYMGVFQTILISSFNVASIFQILGLNRIGFQNYIIIIINSFTLIFTVANISLSGKIQTDLICLLTFPLLSIILIFQLNFNHQKYMVQVYQTNPDQLQYKMAYILQIKSDKHKENSIFFKFDKLIFLQNHKNIIQKDKTLIEKEYFKYLCNEFQKQIINSNKDSDRFIYYLHSISAISELGYNTQALKQAGNVLLDNSSYFSIHTLNKQQSYSSHQTQKLELDSPVKIQKLKGNTLSSLQKIKLEVLQELIQQGINETFKISGDSFQEIVSEAVKLFLDTEIKQKQQIQEILSIITLKKEFLIDFTTKPNLDSQHLFNQTKTIVMRMEKFQKLLDEVYEIFPSQKLQSIYSFYIGEVQGNFSKAHQIATLTKVHDDKLQLFQKNLSINLFSVQTNYLNCELQNDLNISIKDQSSYCHRFFDYKSTEFTQFRNINPLLPYGFSGVHKILIQRFLETGQSKYFRKSNLNIAQTKSKFLKQFEFFFEINNMSTTNLQMTAFLQEHSGVNDCQILINPNQRIAGVTKNIFKLVRYHPQTVNQLNLIQFLYKQKVTSVLPDFFRNYRINDTLADNYDEEIGNYSARLSFLKESYVLNQLQESNMFFDWENPQNIDTYTASLDIIKYEAFTEVYWLVNISNIRLQTMTHTNTTYSIVKSSKMNQFNISSMDISDESQFNLPNAIIVLDRNSEQSSKDSLKKDQQFGNKMIAISNTQGLDQIQLPEIRLERTKNAQFENSYYPQDIGNQQIFSPKESFSGFMNESQRKNQQLFFQSSIKDCSDSASLEQSKIQVDIAQQLYNLEADDEIKKDIEYQLINQRNDLKQDQIQDVDDQGSQVSSLVGFKKSKYYRKYELYDKFQEAQRFPAAFKLMVFFFIFSNIVGLVYSILIIQNSQTDLFRFLSEIDMISIKGALLGPLQKFNIVLLQIASYTLNLYVFGGNPVTISQQSKFVIAERSLSYDLLKSNFQTQMSNKYVQQFFVDETILVHFQKGLDGLQNRTLEFREALSLLVEYGYIYKVAKYDDTKSNYPHITYHASNLLTFTDRLTSLIDTIKQYTIQRTYTVQDKWLTIFIPFLIITLLFQTLSFLAYKKYLLIYDNSLQFFQQIQRFQIQNEIIRLKVITDFINRDVATVFRYYFDLDLKDQYILAQQNKELVKEISNQTKIVHPSKKKLKLSLFPSLILFSFLALIFLIFAVIIEVLVQQFLIEFRPSISYYKQLADVSIAITGVYVYREVSYYQNQFKSFYFFTQQDVQQFIQLYSSQMQIVIKFQQELVIFDEKNQLTSNTYIDQINEIKRKNICSYLSKEEYDLALIHCNNIYDGVILQGLTQTLISIINHLETEFSVNNFTARASLPYQEVEISIITYQVMTQLLQYYKESLVTIIDNLIKQFQIIAIIFIVYISVQTVLLTTIIQNYFQAEFLTVKRFLQILPQSMLFVDSTFERSLRTFINQNQLI